MQLNDSDNSGEMDKVEFADMFAGFFEVQEKEEVDALLQSMSEYAQRKHTMESAGVTDTDATDQPIKE